MWDRHPTGRVVVDRNQVEEASSRDNNVARVDNIVADSAEADNRDVPVADFHTDDTTAIDEEVGGIDAVGNDVVH